MANRQPWFKWYVADHATRAVHWDLETEGAITRLLNHQWIEGALPSDPKELRKLLRVTPKKFVQIWEKIGRYFDVADDGKQLHNSQLETNRKELEKISEFQAEKARKRWDRNDRTDAAAYAADDAGDYAERMPLAMPEAMPEGMPQPSRANANQTSEIRDPDLLAPVPVQIPPHSPPLQPRARVMNVSNLANVWLQQTRWQLRNAGEVIELIEELAKRDGKHPDEVVLPLVTAFVAWIESCQLKPAPTPESFVKHWLHVVRVYERGVDAPPVLERGQRPIARIDHSKKGHA